MLQKQPITQFRSDIAQKILKNHIKGYIPHLDHMCVTISCPTNKERLSTVGDNNRKLLMLSPIDKVETHYYNETNFARFDKGLSSKLYHKYIFYPWSDGTFGPDKSKIDLFKEEVYGLYAGHFVSIKLENNFYLIFGIASHCKDPKMQMIFANNIPRLIEAGLAFYSYLKPYFAEHTDITLPKLNEQPAKLLDETASSSIETNTKRLLMPDKLYKPYLRLVT